MSVTGQNRLSILKVPALICQAPEQVLDSNFILLLNICVLFQYTVLSKRFSPAAINFLHGVLDMAVPSTNIKSASIVYPVHISSRARNLLVSETSIVRYGICSLHFVQF